MKRIHQFLDEMELNIEQREDLITIAKGFVQEFRSIESESALSDDKRNTEYQNLFLRTFEKLNNDLGNINTEIIYRWANQTFQYGTSLDAQVFLWLVLFRRLGELGGNSDTLIPVMLASQKLQNIKKIIIKYLSNEKSLQDRINKVDKEPMSSWEEQVYGTYTKDASPMDWVKNTINFVKVKSIWREMMTVLNGEEIEVLQDWARRQAESMKISSTLIKIPKFIESQ